MRKLTVAKNLVLAGATFAWDLGEKAHPLKFFLEVAHDPVARHALEMLSTGGVAIGIAVAAVAALVFLLGRNSVRAERGIFSRRGCGVTIVIPFALWAPDLFAA